ncbi:MAG: RNA methyltransferase [Candidatus Omnitrophica bacterium]|nr:RNA methyltransferase [Candidatus Omnitrophota bacterium]
MKLYGINPVVERIKKDPRSILNLYLREKTDLSKVVLAARSQKLDFKAVSKEEFLEITDKLNTQGVVAEVEEFIYTPYDELLDELFTEHIIPVFVDGLTDPQNLGSIIRHLACLGGFSLVIPEHNSVNVNETVLRVASGGENYLKIAIVANNASSISKAKSRGIKIIGAEIEDAQNIVDVTLPSKGNIAVVIGSEGKGIRPGISKLLDIRATIPMPGAQLSYNAAVATTLFCYEINRKLKLGA